ncbi:hypothetical protein SELMODRAFT_428567 [Selaginella moellendorffii]|uniref:Uncharacterized protein n=1 Tax=Selaginella moellendorffii TaxID=88036 RepID=D8T399_SELML|nr:hypothetical protein SELMODRAFT_428567 [Selaginella moellendorffii]
MVPRRVSMCRRNVLNVCELAGYHTVLFRQDVSRKDFCKCPSFTGKGGKPQSNGKLRMATQLLTVLVMRSSPQGSHSGMMGKYFDLYLDNFDCAAQNNRVFGREKVKPLCMALEGEFFVAHGGGAVDESWEEGRRLFQLGKPAERAFVTMQECKNKKGFMGERGFWSYCEAWRSIQAAAAGLVASSRHLRDCSRDLSYETGNCPSQLVPMFANIDINTTMTTEPPQGLQSDSREVYRLFTVTIYKTGNCPSQLVPMFANIDINTTMTTEPPQGLQSDSREVYRLFTVTILRWLHPRFTNIQHYLSDLVQIPSTVHGTKT